MPEDMNSNNAGLENINLHPIDILLVEDNDPDVKVTLRAFSKAKIKNNIFVVNDGPDVFEFLDHKGRFVDRVKYPRPDLILLDINLPKMDGFQILDQLKKHSSYNFIPVVMLTSSKNEEDVMKSYGHGASSYIQKPVKYDDFIKVVEGFNFYWQIINKLPDHKNI